MSARKWNRSLVEAPSAHRPCPTWKRSYSDRQTAERAVEAAAVGRGVELGVYRCPDCRRWHLTSHPTFRPAFTVGEELVDVSGRWVVTAVEEGRVTVAPPDLSAHVTLAERAAVARFGLPGAAR